MLLFMKDSHGRGKGTPAWHWLGLPCPARSDFQLFKILHAVMD
jgi:hypothetical protein